MLVLRQASLQIHATASLQILKGLSFKVDAGQKVALVGPSGSGKSTALKLIAKLYHPAQGKITVQARPYHISHLALTFTFVWPALHAQYSELCLIRLCLIRTSLQ